MPTVFLFNRQYSMVNSNGDFLMGKKPTYADLEKRLEKLEEETSTRKSLEEQFRTLSISTPFGMSIMKPDMNFEYFNPKFTEIFGYTIEDLPDKQTWLEKAYPDEKYRQQVFAIWRKDAADESEKTEKKPRIFSVRCKDGQDKIIQFTAVTLEGKRQLLTYLDITEQAKAEEMTNKETAKLSAMISGMEEGVVFADANNVIVEVNAYFCSFVGKKRDEILGMKLEALHSDEIVEKNTRPYLIFQGRHEPQTYCHTAAFGWHRGHHARPADLQQGSIRRGYS